MDVLKILTDKLDLLPPGDHSSGLKAVRLHIEAAIRHFERGQKNQDDAFTDVIYRCNQAFEGSLREAYRVLESKRPEKIPLAQIESSLTTSGVLRTKVLDQFANYRKEWRNSATHDYMLNFNESEALLAIVSVTVFSIVLCDQIQSRLAFLAAQSTAPIIPLSAGTLLDQVAEVVRRFSEDHFPQFTVRAGRIPYEQLEGGLAGYLSAELAKHSMRVSQEVLLNGGVRGDIVVQSTSASIAIELKVVRQLLPTIMDQAIYRLTKIVESGKLSGGVALTLLVGAGSYEIVEPVRGDNRIKLILPTEPKTGK
jgi:hypothetical protein